MIINILLQGTFVKELENYAGKMIKDNLFMTVNDFKAYDFIMETVGKAFDYIHTSSDPWNWQPEIREYLSKHLNTKIITSAEAWEKCQFEDLAYRFEIEKISCGNSKYQGWPKYNSLTALLLIFLSRGYRAFNVFGCDGGGRDHYGSDHPDNHSDILIDTDVMNKRFWSEVEHIGVDPAEVSIINVNPHSRVDCFIKMSYQDFFGSRETISNHKRKKW